jgi:lipid A disaccharide synthetase
MNTFTMIVGTALILLLAGFLLRLSYVIMMNLVNGRKFHHELEQQFSKLRLSRMLSALGINKTAYIYQTRVNDIQQQMNNCSDCNNTDQCDETLSGPELNVTDIDFCNNEAEFKEIKQQQSA